MNVIQLEQINWVIKSKYSRSADSELIKWTNCKQSQESVWTQSAENETKKQKFNRDIVVLKHKSMK